jgi:hypothetical protein
MAEAAAILTGIFVLTSRPTYNVHLTLMPGCVVAPAFSYIFLYHIHQFGKIAYIDTQSIYLPFFIGLSASNG